MCKKKCIFAAENLNDMPKQNTALLLSRYIWLIDTIYSAGHISREEINRRWCRSLLSDGETAISERTFHRYRDAIADLFQIDISFSKLRGYYIENTSDFQRNDLRKWMISTFAVNNLMNEGVHLRKHIGFEPMPSGQQYLTSVLEAIATDTFVITTYNGGARELITSEEYGIITKGNTVSETKAALEKAMGTSYRNTACNNAYQRLVDGFTWQKTAENLISLVK